MAFPWGAAATRWHLHCVCVFHLCLCFGRIRGSPYIINRKQTTHGAFQSLVHGSYIEKLHKPFGIQELIILNRPRKQKTHGANQRNSEKGNCSYLHGILGSACPFPKYLVCKMNMGNVVSIVADFVSGRQQHFFWETEYSDSSCHLPFPVPWWCCQRMKNQYVTYWKS